MAEPSWAGTDDTFSTSLRNNNNNINMSSTGNMGMNSMASTPAADEVASRTAVVSDRLKKIYRKAVLPVEKKYRYDYFYDSPLMSDVEFDGTCVCACVS